MASFDYANAPVIVRDDIAAAQLARISQTP